VHGRKREGLGSEKVDFEAHYDQNIIPKWQVFRMMGQMETILSKLTSPASKGEKIGEMDILSAIDCATIYEWNKDPLPFINKCVHKAFAEKARSQPQAVAVRSWDAQFSYKELDHFSDALAHYLLELGVGVIGTDFVPLCFEKSAFTIVAMLAVLKVGGAFVPLDPAHPISRLREIVGDVEAGLVLCSPCHAQVCEAVAPQVLAVDEAMLRRLPASPYPPSNNTDPSAAAYVIFTSGTTGKPKGTLSKLFAAILK
jgi:non-ribosomal peptide synthetase component F